MFDFGFRISFMTKIRNVSIFKNNAYILNMTLTFILRILLNEKFSVNVEISIEEDIC